MKSRWTGRRRWFARQEELLHSRFGCKGGSAGRSRRRFPRPRSTYPDGPSRPSRGEEFTGIFLDAWRLERDYFYDRQHARRGLGCDAGAVSTTCEPSRGPGQLNGCNCTDGQRTFCPAHLRPRRRCAQACRRLSPRPLGARLRRDEKAGGYVVEHNYQHDPDLPDLPLRLPGPRHWSRKAK